MRALVLGLFVAGMIEPRAASAGACPSNRLAVAPAGAALPTNVTLRVIFEARFVELSELADDGSRQILASDHVNAADVEVIVREKSGRVVPVNTMRTTASTRPIILVKPRSPLPPATAHVVVVRTKTRDFIVSRFTTGAGPDDTPPALATVSKTQYFRWPQATHWKDASGTFVELAVTGVADALGFEIHELAANATPSEATLRAIVYGRSGSTQTLRFGRLDACRGSDFEFPTAKQLRLSIRAFDAAGNVSPPREFTLDLARPRTAR